MQQGSSLSSLRLPLLAVGLALGLLLLMRRVSASPAPAVVPAAAQSPACPACNCDLGAVTRALEALRQQSRATHEMVAKKETSSSVEKKEAGQSVPEPASSADETDVNAAPNSPAASASSSEEKNVGGTPAGDLPPIEPYQRLRFVQCPGQGVQAFPQCPSYQTIEEKYNALTHEDPRGDKVAPMAVDIREHMPMMRVLGTEVSHITEIGVRSVMGSWAFAMATVDRARVGLPSTYVASDITRQGTVDELEKLVSECGPVTFKFVEGNDLKATFEPTELLFIDTWHTFRQLFRELDVLHKISSKYILLHDTTSFMCHDEGAEGHGGKPIDEELFKGVESKTGEWPAVDEFLQRHPEWFMRLRATNNNGMTILQRVDSRR